MNGAIFFELGAETSLGGTRRQPADHRPNSDSQDQRDGNGQDVDGHEYRTLCGFYRDITNGSHASGSCSSAA